ncbi:MAG: TlpA family protein disulfide reductase [bacterium]
MKKMTFATLVTLLFCIPGMGKDNADLAMNFKGVSTTGEKIVLSELRGKVVVLDFWASWCGPCRKEFPFLIKLYKEFNSEEDKNLEIVAVNLDEHSENMNKFLAKLKVETPFPVMPDPKGSLPKLYKVEGMPTTIFIDRKGVIRFRHTGFTEKERQKYVKELTQLLNED